MVKYDALIKQYPNFYYKDYSMQVANNTLTIDYHFEIEGLDKFSTQWTFPVKANFNISSLNSFVFSLGLAEAISYWKLTCSPNLVCQCGEMGEEQEAWWRKLIYHGLGEFFYRNGIAVDKDRFVKIRGTKDNSPSPLHESQQGSKASFVIPVGGGKDSIVSLELLKDAVDDGIAYIINRKESSVLAAKTAGYPESQIICATRKLDPKILEYNKQGFLNGHIPFSSVVAFSAVLTAAIYNKTNIALSNEASANEPSVLGSDVNHQYSKSFEFEQDFHNYVRRYLSRDIRYFSFLRVYHEIQIGAIFAKFPQYHSIFRSCNADSKTDSWCGKCAKCLFSCIILSPFLPSKEVDGIFGKSLLDDPSLYPILLELGGKTQNKPFECVGTVSEVECAIFMTIARYKKEGIPLPVLLARYALDHTPTFGGGNLFADYNRENLVPQEYTPILKEWGEIINHEYSTN